MKASLLLYDIPVGVGPNPSGRLRSIAARVQLSCWIVPEQNVTAAWAATEKIRGKGCSVELVRFDENDAGTIVRLAREALSGELNRMYRALQNGLGKLHADLAAIEPGDVKAWEQSRAFAYRQVRAAKKLAVDAGECALAFDILGEIAPLRDGLMALAKARAELYFAAVEDAKPRVFGQQAVAL